MALSCLQEKYYTALCKLLTHGQWYNVYEKIYIYIYIYYYYHCTIITCYDIDEFGVFRLPNVILVIVYLCMYICTVTTLPKPVIVDTIILVNIYKCDA